MRGPLAAVQRTGGAAKSAGGDGDRVYAPHDERRDAGADCGAGGVGVSRDSRAAFSAHIRCCRTAADTERGGAGCVAGEVGADGDEHVAAAAADAGTAPFKYAAAV